MLPCCLFVFGCCDRTICRPGGGQDILFFSLSAAPDANTCAARPPEHLCRLQANRPLDATLCEIAQQELTLEVGDLSFSICSGHQGSPRILGTTWYLEVRKRRKRKLPFSSTEGKGLGQLQYGFEMDMQCMLTTYVADHMWHSEAFELDGSYVNTRMVYQMNRGEKKEGKK